MQDAREIHGRAWRRRLQETTAGDRDGAGNQKGDVIDQNGVDNFVRRGADGNIGRRIIAGKAIELVVVEVPADRDGGIAYVKDRLEEYELPAAGNQAHGEQLPADCIGKDDSTGGGLRRIRKKRGLILNGVDRVAATENGMKYLREKRRGTIDENCLWHD